MGLSQLNLTALLAPDAHSQSAGGGGALLPGMANSQLIALAQHHNPPAPAPSRDCLSTASGGGVQAKPTSRSWQILSDFHQADALAWPAFSQTFSSRMGHFFSARTVFGLALGTAGFAALSALPFGPAIALFLGGEMLRECVSEAFSRVGGALAIAIQKIKDAHGDPEKIKAAAPALGEAAAVLLCEIIEQVAMFYASKGMGRAGAAIGNSRLVKMLGVEPFMKYVAAKAELLKMGRESGPAFKPDHLAPPASHQAPGQLTTQNQPLSLPFRPDGGTPQMGDVALKPPQVTAQAPFTAPQPKAPQPKVDSAQLPGSWLRSRKHPLGQPATPEAQFQIRGPGWDRNDNGFSKPLYECAQELGQQLVYGKTKPSMKSLLEQAAKTRREIAFKNNEGDAQYFGKWRDERSPSYWASNINGGMMLPMAMEGFACMPRRQSHQELRNFANHAQEAGLSESEAANLLRQIQKNHSKIEEKAFTEIIDGQPFDLSSVQLIPTIPSRLKQGYEGGPVLEVTHVEPALSAKLIAQADKLLREIMENPKLSQEAVIKKVAEIHYLLAHAMPFQRGSAAITDVVTKAIFFARGIHPGRWIVGAVADEEAFFMDKGTFIDTYHLRFE